MKALIQRVTQAQVQVSGKTVGKIDRGLLVLLGVDAGDSHETMQKLAERVMHYRVFADVEGRMNLSLLDTQGEMLIVSQFTLSADTRKGRRPSFTLAATPDKAEELYTEFVEYCRGSKVSVETGQFAADMQVSLTNDGPVTFLLEA